MYFSRKIVINYFKTLETLLVDLSALQSVAKTLYNQLCLIDYSWNDWD